MSDEPISGRILDFIGQIFVGIDVSICTAFKSRLSKWLAVVFLLVFSVGFFEKASLDEFESRQHQWSGVIHGIWWGSIAVLMALSFIVLWKLANKDSKDTPSS